MLLCVESFAQPAANSAARLTPVLVELFTSEGCSSCPPADTLLAEIDGKLTRDHRLMIGISEHVTYWNHLGWTDPYSAPSYTERQSAYARALSLDSNYTPQMVVNGRRQFVGSDRAQLERALRDVREEASGVSLRILSAATSGNELTVTYSAAFAAKPVAANLVAVLTDDLDRSRVGRGENSGRTLSHVAVARSMTRIAVLAPGSGTAGPRTVQLALPPSFEKSAAHHVILFAQQGNAGVVLGADTSRFE